MKIFKFKESKRNAKRESVTIVTTGNLKFEVSYGELDFDFHTGRHTLPYDSLNVSYEIKADIFNENEKKSSYDLKEVCSIKYYKNKDKNIRKTMQNDVLEFIVGRGERGTVRKELENSVAESLRKAIEKEETSIFHEIIDDKIFNFNISFNINKDDLGLK
ncbi:hypothetical protein P9294_gp176 [Bacillus phage FADO]|uniref:Uncharacterized protein n=1 Tax=Bacillus phage FADO TaxID=2917160 RepID=A0AAE9G9X1_9CAUD|nr:hypothetical protein P9294_gp176 [Bacillus phage FADO]UNY48891.1 hypothetical protein fado_176 [Bacillus phage FADO]